MEMKTFLMRLGVGLLKAVGLVVVCWLVLAAYFLVMGRDITPSDDSDLRLDAPVIPDAENGYLAFLAVTNLYALSTEDATVCTDYRTWRRSGKLSRYHAAHTNDWQTTVDRVLADHVPYFAGLHKAATCPHYGFVKDGGEWGGLFAMPPVTAMMRANALWTTKAMRETERHDHAAALETVRTHFAFGRMMGDNPSTIIEMLLGQGIRSSAESEIIALATCEDVPDAILSELAVIARDEPDTTASFARAVRCEYGEYDRRLDKLYELFVPSGDKRGLEIIWRCLSWTPGYRRFSLQLGATKQAYADVVRAMLKGVPSDSVVPDLRMPYAPNWMGCMLLRRIVPSTHSLDERLMRTVLHTRFAQLIVAAQRYRRMHDGACPPSLEALVPAFLEAVPHDPFAPDREFGYDAGRELVWSVGEKGDFNPFAEQHGNPMKFNRDMEKYAIRLDGKPHERRKK